MPNDGRTTVVPPSGEGAGTRELAGFQHAIAEPSQAVRVRRIAGVVEAVDSFLA